jgi:hypothetical protein
MLLDMLARSQESEDKLATERKRALSLLAVIRKQGFAERDPMVEPRSSNTIAAPIMFDERVLATVGMTYFTSALDRTDLVQRYVPLVKGLADNIAANVASLQQLDQAKRHLAESEDAALWSGVTRQMSGHACRAVVVSFRDRPGAHGQPAYLRQLVTRCPVARLHCEPARYRAVVGRQHVAIGVFRQIAFCDALSNAFRHGAFRKRAVLGHHVANIVHSRRAMRARERNHAAERVTATGELFGRGLEQPREGHLRIARRVI